MYGIVGIDEVGRGCWAGPLVAAAVLLDKPIAGLADSKELTRNRREVLAQQIAQNASAIGIGWVWPDAIDRDGLTVAVRSAMSDALQAIDVAYDDVIIDGNINYLAHKPKTHAVVKADGTVPAVSAASIIAKVARDNYMVNIANRYKGYGFEQHVGYGTAQHIAALRQLGICDIHRKSFKPIAAHVSL